MEKAIHLVFEEYGQGLPVIFLHGFPLDHTIWDAIVPLLMDDARLILPDLRGYGGTPATDGVYTMRLMADDVLQLMDTLKLEQAVLVGHSMGGYISLAFAHAYPNRLAGLGLVASQAAVDTTERRQARYQTADEVMRRGMRKLAASMPAKLTDRPELADTLQKMVVKADRRAVAGSLRGMAERADAVDWLAEIRVPALVVAGLRDVLIPAERSKIMAQMLPMGWLVELETAAHMPMMEEPTLTASALHELIHQVKDVRR
jgi:3-oxoadipate enol-lactonase